MTVKIGKVTSANKVGYVLHAYIPIQFIGEPLKKYGNTLRDFPTAGLAYLVLLISN